MEVYTRIMKTMATYPQTTDCTVSDFTFIGGDEQLCSLRR